MSKQLPDRDKEHRKFLAVMSARTGLSEDQIDADIREQHRRDAELEREAESSALTAGQMHEAIMHAIENVASLLSMLLDELRALRSESNR
jgi:hypothetical protein